MSLLINLGRFRAETNQRMDEYSERFERGRVKLQTRMVLNGPLFVFFIFVCFFVAVFDLLHDFVAIFDFLTN